MNGELPPFIGTDARVRAALGLAERVAPTHATVLIVGETGTGKELIARFVHQQSARNRQTFLPVNCGAIADTLVESELFGHARGAFTGATTRKSGKFEVAHRGTLFMDEVTSMSNGMQAALLRVLQSGEYCPVGATIPLTCDVRVVAAANRELKELVAAGSFRADLFYRLNIVRIALPPLRDRRDDLPVLVEHILRKHGARLGRSDLQLDATSMRQLRGYDFPGNVRELESLLQRGVILSDGPIISLDGVLDGVLDSTCRAKSTEHRPSTSVSANFHHAKASVVEQFERDFLVNALHHCHGIITEAARVSGLSERNFHLKLRKYRLVKQPHGDAFGEPPADNIISSADNNVSPGPLSHDHTPHRVVVNAL